MINLNADRINRIKSTLLNDLFPNLFERLQSAANDKLEKRDGKIKIDLIQKFNALKNSS